MGKRLEPFLDTLRFINRPYILKGNELYPEPQQPRAIVFCDGTYFEVEKSCNFQTYV